MTEKQKGYWFNYTKNEFEHTETPDDFSDYVPTGAARGLYELLVKHRNMKPIDAAIDVLSRCVGEK